MATEETSAIARPGTPENPFIVEETSAIARPGTPENPFIVEETSAIASPYTPENPFIVEDPDEVATGSGYSNARVLTADQKTWLGGADPNDPYIMARMEGSSFIPNESLTNLGSNLSNGLTNGITTLGANIKNGISDTVDNISNIGNGLANVKNKITALFTPGSPAAANAVQSLINGSGVSGALSALENISAGRIQAGGVPISSILSTPSAAIAKWANPDGSNSSSGGGNSSDWRLKVSLIDSTLFRGGLLTPLEKTGGFIFPVTPQINITHTAKYSSLSPTHSNYAMQFFESSEVGAIQITGEFPVQSAEDGEYLLAGLYLFRAATKMFWGEDALAGTPPPMLKLSGYGVGYLPDVPCVLTSLQHTLPEDKDYINVNGTWIPTLSTLTITLQPLYSRNAMTSFDLKSFAAGSLLWKGFI